MWSVKLRRKGALTHERLERGQARERSAGSRAGSKLGESGGECGQCQDVIHPGARHEVGGCELHSASRPTW